MLQGLRECHPDLHPYGVFGKAVFPWLSFVTVNLRFENREAYREFPETHQRLFRRQELRLGSMRCELLRLVIHTHAYIYIYIYISEVGGSEHCFRTNEKHIFYTFVLSKQ